MQNDINQLFSSLSPQTFGLTDPMSLTLLALLGPGAVMFTVLFFGRELLRPRWRGHWDAV